MPMCYLTMLLAHPQPSPSSSQMAQQLAGLLSELHLLPTLCFEIER